MGIEIDLGYGRTPDGQHMTLSRDGDTFLIRVGPKMLMASRAHESEDMLGILGTDGFERTKRARVLVGGLGLGYTLRTTLDGLGEDAIVEVVEVMRPVVDWHREGPLGALTQHAIRDPRVKVVIGDLAATLRAAPPAHYEALLLDVDNGPEAISTKSNRWLYGEPGLAHIATLLRPRGRVIFWSAFDDDAFARRLAATGLTTRTERVNSGLEDRSMHTLFIGERAR